MPVAHQAAAARLGLEIGMSMQEITDLRLNGLCQQGTCAAAQNLGERIREGPWLRKLENVSVDHGVSLLRWRSGGVEHPHDTPPYPFMPSPTFAHSSNQVKVFRTDDFMQIAAISTGALPHGLWPSGDGSRIYVGLENADQAAVIDTASNTVVANIPVGQGPQGVTYVPNAAPAGINAANLQPFARSTVEVLT